MPHATPRPRSGWRQLLLGDPRDPHDRGIHHQLSLIAFLAWIGLGADGLSSSCYGPEEAFRTLAHYPSLALFVAAATAATVFIISASYAQIVELFPSGGGGYLVASKLLGPTVGMVSGSALVVDYVLTVTIQIASSVDAVLNFCPAGWLAYKLEFALLGVAVLMVLNLRGVKESVTPLVPIFLVFLVTHAFLILYALVTHLLDFGAVAARVGGDLGRARADLGLAGMFFLVLRAYGMGAGTYTGIEATSNGMQILREPKVETAKRTMRYMAWSLALTAGGLMVAYLLFSAPIVEGKTLNATLIERATAGWNPTVGHLFLLVTLFSEATLLYVGAQAGFLDGPRVLANMALDRWLPSRFAMLSDRLVTQNGILLMGGASLLIMILAHGSVAYLVVLYSINVFVTFALSQLGMVVHWWQVRRTEPCWVRRFLINGVGLVLSAFILVSMVVLKFFDGGWITLVITGSLVALCLGVKRHYGATFHRIRALDRLVEATKADAAQPVVPRRADERGGRTGRTAVLLVNGFNGLGLHSLFAILRLFGETFDRYVFLQVGMIDAGNFKGAAEIENLERHLAREVNQYVGFMTGRGYRAEGQTATGVDVVLETVELARKVRARFPEAVIFGGQLLFPEETFLTRILHNPIVFSVQRRLYQEGIPFVMLPARI